MSLSQRNQILFRPGRTRKPLPAAGGLRLVYQCLESLWASCSAMESVGWIYYLEISRPNAIMFEAKGEYKHLKLLSLIVKEFVLSINIRTQKSKRKLKHLVIRDANLVVEISDSFCNDVRFTSWSCKPNGYFAGAFCAVCISIQSFFEYIEISCRFLSKLSQNSLQPFAVAVAARNSTKY